MCLAVPGKLVEIRENAGLRMGRVEFAGVSRDVFLDYVPETQLGDYVLVHVGFAISKVDPEEARKTYELLEQMGLLEGEDEVPR